LIVVQFIGITPLINYFNNYAPEGLALISLHMGAVLGVWNNGMMEQWRIGLKNNSIPQNPSFQYSIIPAFHGDICLHGQSAPICPQETCFQWPTKRPGCTLSQPQLKAKIWRNIMRQLALVNIFFDFNKK
jgi:hypothetical protein